MFLLSLSPLMSHVCESCREMSFLNITIVEGLVNGSVAHTSLLHILRPEIHLKSVRVKTVRARDLIKVQTAHHTC
jgi:hypothetical protein